MVFSSLVHLVHRRLSIKWLVGNWQSVSNLPPDHSSLTCSHTITLHRATPLLLLPAVFTLACCCFNPSKVSRAAGGAWKPEGAGRGSLLLIGHCPQSNLWANWACSQVNLFKLVSESNPAAQIFIAGLLCARHGPECPVAVHKCRGGRVVGRLRLTEV